MRLDWNIPICSGNERIRATGKNFTPLKPEALLSRVILSSTKKVGDVILDPFIGSGSTAAVAKKLSRNWIGIEKEKKYIREAKKRIESINKLSIDSLEFTKSKKEEPRILFGSLIERGLISPGELLFDGRKRWFAKVRVDGSLISDKSKGSIHSVGAEVQGLSACNGWNFLAYKLQWISCSDRHN